MVLSLQIHNLTGRWMGRGSPRWGAEQCLHGCSFEQRMLKPWFCGSLEDTGPWATGLGVRSQGYGPVTPNGLGRLHIELLQSFSPISLPPVWCCFPHMTITKPLCLEGDHPSLLESWLQTLSPLYASKWASLRRGPMARAPNTFARWLDSRDQPYPRYPTFLLGVRWALWGHLMETHSPSGLAPSPLSLTHPAPALAQTPASSRMLTAASV